MSWITYLRVRLEAPDEHEAQLRATLLAEDITRRYPYADAIVDDLWQTNGDSDGQIS